MADRSSLPMTSRPPGVAKSPALLGERILANLATNGGRALQCAQQRLAEEAERTRLLAEADQVALPCCRRQVDLRIADRGPGIPPARRDRVFQPFQRLGDRDNHTGVGLGLALARGLTEAMNGTLIPDDTPGGGLTMILTLPAAATPAAAEARGAMPGIRRPPGDHRLRRHLAGHRPARSLLTISRSARSLIPRERRSLVPAR